MPTAFKLAPPPSHEPPAFLGLLPQRGRSFQSSWLYRPDKPLTAEELGKFSTKVELQSPITEAKRVDFMVRGTDTVISSRVVKAIEALEPGRHQFIEVQIQNMPDALKRRELQFYLVNCCLYLDCIDKEASGLDNIYDQNPKLPPSYIETQGRDLYALPSWRPTAHLWRDAQWLRSNHFISGELKQRLDVINAGPITYRPVHLV